MKNSYIENPKCGHMLWCLLYTWSLFLFLRNIKISIFGDISKFLKLIVFGLIVAKKLVVWVALGRISCIGSG
jgi:hypothetical protein